MRGATSRPWVTRPGLADHAHVLLLEVGQVGLASGFLAEGHQVAQLLVAELGEAGFAASEYGVRQRPLAVEQCRDPLLDRAPGDHPVHLDRLGLADPVGAVGGLLLDGRVPPAVDVDHVVGAGEVEAGAARLEAEQEDRHALPVLGGLEPGDHRLALRHRGPAVEELVGHADAGEVLLDQPRHRDVLREDEHRSALRDDGADQLVEQLQLLRATGEPDRAGLLEELRRVVADLLEPGQQGQHQAAPGVLVGALDAVHGVAHERLVEHRLLAGETEQVVGLGLRGQLGSDARVGLAAAQQERADQVGELTRLGRLQAGLDRRSPHPAERLAAAEQAGDRPVEDRPQLGEVVLDGGAGQGHPRPARDQPQVAGRRRAGVLDVLRLVGDDQVPRDLGESGVVAAHRAVRRQHEPAVDAPELALRAVEPADGQPRCEPVDLGLPVAEQAGRADHESRRAAGDAVLEPMEVERDQGDGLAEPHVVGEAGAEPEPGEVGEPGQPVPLVVAQLGAQAGRRGDRVAGRGGQQLLADLQQGGADDRPRRWRPARTRQPRRRREARPPR